MHNCIPPLACELSTHYSLIDSLLLAAQAVDERTQHLLPYAVKLSQYCAQGAAHLGWPSFGNRPLVDDIHASTFSQAPSVGIPDSVSLLVPPPCQYPMDTAMQGILAATKFYNFLAAVSVPVVPPAYLLPLGHPGHIAPICPQRVTVLSTSSVAASACLLVSISLNSIPFHAILNTGAAISLASQSPFELCILDGGSCTPLGQMSFQLAVFDWVFQWGCSLCGWIAKWCSVRHGHC